MTTKKTRSEKDKQQAQEIAAEEALFAKIKAAQDRPFIDRHIDLWGVTVRTVTLSGADRDAINREGWEAVEAGRQGDHLTNLRARNLSRAVVNPETGKRIFDTPEKIKVLGEKNTLILDQLYADFDLLNKPKVDPEAEAKNS